MSVGIDAARDDQLAGGVDRAGAAGDAIQVLTHRLYHPEREIKTVKSRKELFAH